MALSDELRDLLAEQRSAIATLKETMKRLDPGPRRYRGPALPIVSPSVLLKMAEGLIEAHKAAKIDNDGYTLDLIEDALRHVGGRLAREDGDGRGFSRKRLSADR